MKKYTPIKFGKAKSKVEVFKLSVPKGAVVDLDQLNFLIDENAVQVIYTVSITSLEEIN